MLCNFKLIDHQYVTRPVLTFMTCVAGTPAYVEVERGSRFPSLYTLATHRPPSPHTGPQILVNTDLTWGRKPRQPLLLPSHRPQQRERVLAHHGDWQMHEEWQEVCREEVCCGYCALMQMCHSVLTRWRVSRNHLMVTPTPTQAEAAALRRQ